MYMYVIKCMNSVYVYLLLNLMYKICVHMLLDEDCVFFQKLNANCVFYLTVMGELISICLSLLWFLVATGG
jgi:hypothetical protein